MIEETSISINEAPEGMSDLDVTPSNRWVAVNNRQISFGENRIPVPNELWYPKVRAISDLLALVINPRTRDEPNAWIISSEGEVINNFFVGDAVQDVLVLENFFVISYFDESACTSLGIENNGVTVFDVDGNYLFGYRETLGDQAVNVYDCYCTCLADKARILFMAYNDFPLVSLNLITRTQEIFEVPDEVVGANAISFVENIVFFHSPYKDKTGLYKWTIGENCATKVGDYSGRLRGMRNGQFLSVGKTGYTVVIPS